MRKTESAKQRGGLRVLLKGRKGVNCQFIFVPSNKLAVKDWWNSRCRNAQNRYVCIV